MRKLLLIFGLLSVSSISLAQQQEETEHKKNVSTLKYQPTIPAETTYTVVKNTTGEPLTEEIKLEINLHRMKTDYLWRVNAEVEILIHGTEQ